MLVSAPRVLIPALVWAGVTNAGGVQKPDLKLPSTAADNAERVKTMFTNTYGTYKKYAWGHDDLQPVNLTFNDGRNGWGATIVDSLATMFIMGLDDLFKEAVNFTYNINFSQSKTNETVSVFETTIRYIGGILSAYEFTGSKDSALLEKAKQVADKLAFAWIDDNEVPYGFLNFTTNKPTIDTTNIAEAGTLTLEWATLSKYTGNDTYRQLAERSARHIISLEDPLPGLAAQCIDPATGNFTCGYATWGGGSDSYFEYLLKYPLLTGNPDHIFANEWLAAVDSSIKYLLSTSTVGNHTYLADYDSKRRLRYVSSHLACFHGGNWLFGGKILNNDTIANIGLELIEGCWNTYASTTTGFGPELFSWISPEGNFTGGDPPKPEDLEFYNQHGFYFRNGTEYYYLRPEVLESNFIAWRITGDEKYYQRAVDAINNFDKYLKINNAYAGIWDTRNATSGFIDDTQSFFYAEVLKYLYLTFDDPNHISIDEYIFNTEAQPLRIGGGDAESYTGSGSGLELSAELVAQVTVDMPSDTKDVFPAFSSLPFNEGRIMPQLHGNDGP